MVGSQLGRRPTLLAALKWAAAGWPIVPCNEDPESKKWKSPYPAGGKDVATTDELQLRQWWQRWPCALIGGRCDGKVVIDMDTYKDPEGHAKALDQLPGPLLATRTHSTPQGGTHLIYLDPTGGTRSGKLSPTIDVRAGGSNDYIILPTPGRSWEVVADVPLAAMPPWLPALLGRSRVNGDGKGSGTRPMPEPQALPNPVPKKLEQALSKRETDRSQHTFNVAVAGAKCRLTDGQLLTLLEHDLITTERRGEAKRESPDWWPREFWSVVDKAREKAETEATPSIAAVLMAIADEHYEFGIADDGEPFALPRSGPLVVRMLRGDRYSLRAELSHRYHELYGAPPSNSAIADVLVALEGQAQLADPIPLPLRVARHGDDLVLDLGDRSGRAVVVSAGVWEVVDRSPVLFRRTRLTAALPEPVRGYKLTDTLLPFINVAKEDWSLLAACLVSMLWPDIPHPIPHLTGTEGVAKTATTRVLRSLMDPSSVPTRGKPEEKDWDVALQAQWVVALDNLSTIPPWLSDALCRAVTGEGAVRRKLYTDNDMAMISVRRVMMINGISTEIANADLAGRTITFELEAIRAYRDESDLATEWEAVHPRALGALLDMAAGVLKVRDTVHVEPIFRMADFARITASLDSITGSKALESYRRRLESSALDVLHLDDVGTAILKFAHTLKGRTWEGSIDQLDSKLRALYGRQGPPAGWPKTSVAWGTKLKRVGNPLRRAGVEITKVRHGRGMVFTVRQV